MTVVIETGGKPSTGARRFARALGIRRLRGDDTNYRYHNGDCIINWGCTRRRVGPVGSHINAPGRVNAAGSKIHSLNIMQEAGVQVPAFSTHTRDVDRWLEQGSAVISRTVDRGHGGVGMTIMHPEPEPIMAVTVHGLKHWKTRSFLKGTITKRRRWTRILQFDHNML